MVTENEAIKKYGKETYLKMLFYLGGITNCYNDKKEIDISESDLNKAYDLVTKGRNNKS